jgi:response regulator RpfG family c-di-GMP phosphodiesterase
LLLIAFSIAFHHLLRARRRSHEDATTDALTGLGNRRRLFADMDQSAVALERETTLAAIFDAKDALLQVLAEQNADLVTHLGHVSDMAARTAATLGLSPSQVGLTRLAAELHDIGKSAMPASILEKARPLDAAERWLM